LTTVDEKLALIRAFSGSAAQIELVDQLPKICLSDILSIDTIRYKDLPITTERIQAALLAGEIEVAEAMLGYPYTLSGEVVYGRQLGRTVGMPTVNLKTADEKLLPAHGVVRDDYHRRWCSLSGRDEHRAKAYGGQPSDCHHPKPFCSISIENSTASTSVWS
jgi:hypothetical protein